MNTYCVYKHTAPNGKVYIGITKQNPMRRWRNGNGYRNSNPHFWRAIRLYGWDNMQHEIIYKELSKEEAEKKEIELINQSHSNQSIYGYNITNGGDGALGRKCSDVTKNKISNANKGHKMPQEIKNKLSMLNSGSGNP